MLEATGVNTACAQVFHKCLGEQVGGSQGVFRCLGVGGGGFWRVCAWVRAQIFVFFKRPVR